MAKGKPKGTIFVLNPETMILTNQDNGKKIPLSKFHSDKPVMGIDPGHGVEKAAGKDHGAPAKFGGKDEAAITYLMAKETARDLAGRGCNVIITHGGAFEESPDGFKFRRAAAAECDAYVSLHVNAAKSPKPHGVQLFSHSGAPKGGLSDTLHLQVAENNRGDMIADSSIRKERYKMLPRDGANLLVEIGFGTNRKDSANMHNPSWRKRFAAELGRELHDFYHEHIARDRKKSRHAPAADEIIVQKGQGLQSIATKLSATGTKEEVDAIMKKLMKENGLKDADDLKAGARLEIPESLLANKAKPAAKKTEETIPTIEVNRGDTLTKIAQTMKKKFGSDLEVSDIVTAVQKVNHLKKGEAIHAGDELTVPWIVRHQKPAQTRA